MIIKLAKFAFLLSTLGLAFALALPTAALTEVHFASVFDAGGNRLTGVWLVGVDCGDGVVHGAGPCSDTPAQCAQTAEASLCSAAPDPSGGSSGPPPELVFVDQLPVDESAGADLSVEAERRRLLDGLDLAIRTIRRQQAAVPWSPDQSVLCYWPGPGCPWWEEQCRQLGLCQESGASVLFRDQPRAEPVETDLGSNVYWSVGGFMLKLVYCAVKTEVEGQQAGIDDPLDGPEGFNKLKRCLSDIPFSLSPTSRWTQWLNRDVPGGSGDWELLREFAKDGQACSDPIAVECATLDGRDWRDTGQSYICSLDGGVCRNADQADSVCLDYHVRFLCPPSSPERAGRQGSQGPKDPRSDSNPAGTFASRGDTSAFDG
jgi:hypothetical protein